MSSPCSKWLTRCCIQRNETEEIEWPSRATSRLHLNCCCRLRVLDRWAPPLREPMLLRQGCVLRVAVGAIQAGQYSGYGEANQDVASDESRLGTGEGGRTGRAGPAAGAVQRRGLAAPSADQSRGKPAPIAGWRLPGPGRAVRGSRRVGRPQWDIRSCRRPAFLQVVQVSPGLACRGAGILGPGSCSASATSSPCVL